MESSLKSPYRDDIVISWPELHRDTRLLCHALMEKGPFKGIIAIARGGMIPAALVARELEIRIVDTISVKSYNHQAQTAPRVIKAPQADIMGAEGEGVLVIDDLVDTGKTLELVRKLYPKAHFATVYAKPAGRAMVDSYITEVSQDTWIFFPWDMALQYVEPYRGRE